ncbi:MAG TPA: sigma-70 family RNA polymerase sigma factor [Solirubrobacterales bacterium]
MNRQRALTSAYRRHHQAIYRYCLAIVGNPDDAQEALQNTMVKALRALEGERREIKLKPWLYRIAHNESIELLRKRRDVEAIDPEAASSGNGLAETAEQRERLRHLLADLRELPDRQRAALVMRELGGLGFDQIGEAFDTSKAVARQTVYEARLGLRELEAGREMGCEEVMHRLSNADGRVARRRDIRAHLRTCPDCRAFRDGIGQRQRDLAALSPLPVAVSAATLQAVFGGKGGAAVGAGLAGTGGAGQAVATSVVLKSAATIAAVTAIGVGVADRDGLIDLGLTGDARHPADVRSVTGTTATELAEPAPGPASDRHEAPVDGGDADAPAPNPAPTSDETDAGTKGGAPTDEPSPAAPGELPVAASDGHETAASHGGDSDAAHSHSEEHSRAPEGAGKPASPPSKPDKPAKPETPSNPQVPANPPGSPPTQGKGPDNSPGPPSQSSEGSPNRGGPSDPAKGDAPKGEGSGKGKGSSST